MNKKEAIKILTQANEWRRGGEGDMPDPKELGLAIDFAVDYMANNLQSFREWAEAHHGVGYHDMVWGEWE